MAHYRPRTFGWVQDPSNFRSLCSVVAVFAPNSYMYDKLVNDLLPRLVSIEDGRERFMAALGAVPLKIKYADLVGTGFTPRSSARCNGIVQAVVPGQRRPFISDWPADNFVRWAQALGFIRYEYASDTFEITQSGTNLVAAHTNGEELNAQEKDILIGAILAYPPAVRVLHLLLEKPG